LRAVGREAEQKPPLNQDASYFKSFDDGQPILRREVGHAGRRLLTIPEVSLQVAPLVP